MSATNPTVESADAVPCHCIIAHPDKPKFLVIRHTDRWAPPILQVPSTGHLMYKPAIINSGMMQKYNLRTTVLRIVMEAQNYALVELELHASSKREMQAVWVGLEEYARFRRSDGGELDPLEQWLHERERDTVSPLRPPWLRRGWYREADNWMSNQLVKHGIQMTGSVQQFKAGWPSACLLSVLTSQGRVYFKATYDKAPGEARLTQMLAENWPDLVVKPLAVDEERNWMLSRDFKMKKENRSPTDSYPEFARSMGRFQVEAMDRLKDWREMGCAVMDHGYLINDDGHLEQLVGQVEPQLREDPMPFGPQELSRLRDAIIAAGDASRALSDFDIPDSLTHLDFRPDNFFLEDGKCRVMDWADVVISHPFMMLCQTLNFFESYETGERRSLNAQPIEESQKSAMEAAYLSAFSNLLPEDKLVDAFEQARAVFPLFWFLYLAAQTRIIEARTPQWNNINSLLKKRAKYLIERHAGEV